MSDAALLARLPESLAHALGRQTVPNGYLQVVDATPLANEWAILLDPTGAILRAAEKTMAVFPEWEIAGRVTPNGAVMRALREAVDDERVRALVAERLPDTAADGFIRDAALPWLLGLACLGSCLEGVGYYSAMTYRKVRARQRERAAQAQAAERRSASEASEEAQCVARPSSAGEGRA